MILTMCFTYHKADFLTLNWYSQLKRKIALIKQNADCLVKLLNWLFLFLHVKKFQTFFFTIGVDFFLLIIARMCLKTTSLQLVYVSEAQYNQFYVLRRQLKKNKK